ncbi:CCA tRNA nucleotidyltransferase [Paenibacillus alvei]|nr:CCA tRNA nucleotidyltransferase [Paenibacillus alvei]
MNTLNEHGFDSYIVGGCVRDSIIGREPKDWDICTNAKPEQVIEMFTKHDFRVVPTGLKHGTVTIVYDEEHFEITTYRTDGAYSDGRRPDTVDFTDSLYEDLRRRDFTMNAMAYNDEAGLIDPYGGMMDLQEKTIVCVGDPNERFREDALRMMRAIRFSSQLGFTLNWRTFCAIMEHENLIKNVSQERIRDELCKILMSDNAREGICDLFYTGLLDFILPELTACVSFEQANPNHSDDVFEHTMSVIKQSPKRLKVRLAALFHDIAKPKTFSLDERGIGHFYNHHMVGMDMTIEIMKRLKFDNKMISDVSLLVKEHMLRVNFPTAKIAKKLINRIGQDNIDDLFELIFADMGTFQLEHDKSGLEELQRLCHEVINEKQPMSLKDLAINGDDLIKAGIKPSREMGAILNNLLDLVIDDPSLNDKEKLMNIVFNAE